jgi:molybdate transport system permease protein
MQMEEFHILIFTLSVAACSTALILPPGVAIAWLLARRNWSGKSMIETLVMLPLVMPPVATGLILLKLLGRRGLIGSFLFHTFDLEIVFTWRAVICAMAVMSFPLLVRSARIAFENVNPRLEQVARTLGLKPWNVFWRVTLPLVARGVISGMLLAFARAIGEFGATVLVAGNIPGKTATLSLSIYQYIQLGQDTPAFRLLAVSVLIAFASVWLSEIYFKRTEKGF